MPKLSYTNAGTDAYREALNHLNFDQIFPANDEHSNFVRSWAAGLEHTEDDDPSLWLSECLKVLQQPQQGETEKQREDRESLYSDLNQMKNQFFITLRSYQNQAIDPDIEHDKMDEWKADMEFVDGLDALAQKLDLYNLHTGHNLMGTPEMRAIYGMMRGMRQVKADLDEKAFQEYLAEFEPRGNKIKEQSAALEKTIKDQCLTDMELGIKPGWEYEAVDTLKSEIDELDRMIEQEKRQLAEDIKGIQPLQIKNRRAALEAMYELDEARIQKNGDDRTQIKLSYEQKIDKLYQDELAAAGAPDRSRYQSALTMAELFKEAQEAFESGAPRKELDEKVQMAIGRYAGSYRTDYNCDALTNSPTMTDEKLKDYLNGAEEEFNVVFRSIVGSNKHLGQADDIRIKKEMLDECLAKGMKPKEILESRGSRLLPKMTEMLEDLQSLDDTEKSLKANQEKTRQGLSAFIKEAGEDPEKELEKLRKQASQKKIDKLEQEALKAKADYDQEKGNNAGSYEKQKNAITEARNKIIADITEKRNILSDRKRKLEAIVNSEDDLRTADLKLRNAYYDYEGDIYSLHHFAADDPRIDRVQESLVNMWEKVDWLTSGSNSNEFNEMRSALEAAKGNCTKDTLEHLKRCTETYLEKKKGFFHIESHKKRSYRLSFAKDLKQLTENGLKSWRQAELDMAQKWEASKLRHGMEDINHSLKVKIEMGMASVQKEAGKEFATVEQQRENLKNSFDQMTEKIEKERQVVKEKIGMLKAPGQKEAGKQVKEPVKEGPELKLTGRLK